MLVDASCAICYSNNRTKEVNTMAGKKKSGKHDDRLATVLMITAILDLIKSIIELIIDLIE